jgi:two-component system sensor histidine kinase KdpD
MDWHQSHRLRSKALRPQWRVSRNPWLSWAQILPERSRDGSKVLRQTVSPLFPYVVATALVAVLPLLCWTFRPLFEPVNTGLLYLFPVLISALWYGLWPSVYAACVGVLAFDYFFIPPIYSYSVSDLRYLISFGVFLAVGGVTAILASSLKRQAENSARRENMAAALLTLSRQMAEADDLDAMMTQVARHTASTLAMPASVVLPDAAGRLTKVFGNQLANPPAGVVSDLLAWVYEHGKPVTFGEKTSSELLYLPLLAEHQTYGVLCLGVYGAGLAFSDESTRVAQAIASLTAVAVARWQFQEQAKIAHLSAESERLRTALLDSLSHELRTPLTTILGAASSLAENPGVLSVTDQAELLQTLQESAVRMNRLVLNLLSMVRIESGMLSVHPEPCDLGDIVGMAVHQLNDTLRHRPVSVHIPDNTSVKGDEGWLQQVIVNLLSNAAKYSPPTSPIDIVAERQGETVLLHIKDLGTGIDPAEQDRVFDKFYRAHNALHIPGTGLGLAICKSIVQAHQGSIVAHSNWPHGTIVTVSLPADDTEADEEEETWVAKS